MTNAVPPLPPPPPRRIAPPPPNDLAIASLVLGIVGVLTSPCLIGGVLGIVGVVTGVLHLQQKSEARPAALIGSILSVFAILAALASLTMWFRFVPVVRGQMAQLENSLKRDFPEWVGVRAPDFSVTTADGQTFTLGDFEGKRVVLEVFQSGDPDCTAQFKNMAALDAEIDDEELVILALTKPGQSGLADFVEDAGVTYDYAEGTFPSPYRDVQWFPTTFYIDRNGVIDATTVDVQELETLRKLAMAPDFAGEVSDSPREPKSTMDIAERQLEFKLAWEHDVDGAAAMCAGDWTGDGLADILVCDWSSSLHVIDSSGKEQQALKLPQKVNVVSRIEFGRNKELGPRLLIHSNFDNKVSVVDTQGKLAWEYSTFGGITAAHWTDIDGDGSDEMLLGTNGFSGVRALDQDGDVVWKSSSTTTCWSLDAPEIRDGQPWRVYVSGMNLIELDKTGENVRNFQGSNTFSMELASAVVDDSGEVQILSISGASNGGEPEVTAYDARGAILWKIRPDMPSNSLFDQSLEFGDIDADGVIEWLIPRQSGGLMAITPKAVQIGVVQPEDSIDQYCVVPASEGRSLIVTLESDTVRAYQLTGTSITAEAEESSNQ